MEGGVLTKTTLMANGYAGGFTAGMLQAGLDVTTSLFEDEFGLATSEANNRGVKHVVGVGNWRAALGDAKFDVVAGCPACVPWSNIGRSLYHGKESWRTDPRLNHTLRLVALGAELRPLVWVTESVPNFWRRGAAADLAKYWNDLGYSTTLVKLDAKFLGVPQQRRRVFLVAHRVAFAPKFPRFDGIVPVGMALEGEDRADPIDAMDPPHPDFVEHLLPRVAPGQHLLGNAPADYAGRRPRFMEHRLLWDHVSGTVAGINVYYHPFEHRHLRWREVAAVCGYPQDWIMTANSPWLAIAELARAVMPPVGRWLGDQVVAALERGEDHGAVTNYVVQHWATSQKLKDLRITHVEGTWDEPIENGDPTWVVEGVTRVANEI